MTTPDQLEPYTVTLRLEARTQIESPSDLITRLLEDIARRCEDAGSSIIGHIKCHATVAGQAFTCSLTSRRSGASCRGEVDAPIAAGRSLRLDLAVLVYGLPQVETEAAVRAAVSGSLPRSSGEWLAIGQDSPHRHTH